MTYCLGIKTHEGLMMASDSRANAGYDQVNVCRKMHTFIRTRRARLCHPYQREPLHHAVGHHAASRRLSARSRSGDGWRHV